MNELGRVVAAFVGQAIAYFTVVGTVWLLVWKLLGRRLQPRKRSARHTADRAQFVHEVRYSLSTLAFGTLGVLVIEWASSRGLAKLSSNPADFTGPQLVLTTLGLLLLNELWFYGCHRLLHTRWLFARVHGVHHRSVEVTPFSSYSFHPVEAFLLGAWIYPVAFTVPLFLPMLAGLQVLGLANNVMSHLGYELFPRWLVRVPGLKWVNSATFHSMHHATVNGNFGLMLRVWDRLFRTEVPGYDEAFSRRGADQPDSTGAEPHRPD